jgi:hypothetical protein
MRKIREILRLAWLCGQSRRDTARTCGVSKSTVDATISRATAAGFSWPLPSDLDDEALERRLYPPVVAPTHRKLSQPDWQSLHDELAKNKQLTLMLLWQEYKEGTPSGYQYSQYCELYRQWRKKLDRSMRQEHRAGEKFFIDYSGQTVPIVYAATGEIRQAQMFVGVMGTSNQTDADLTWRKLRWSAKQGVRMGWTQSLAAGPDPTPAPLRIWAPCPTPRSRQPAFRSDQDLPL